MSPAVLHVAQPAEYGVPSVVASLAEDQLRRGWRVGVAGPLPLGGAEHLPWRAGRQPGPGLAAEVRSLSAAIRRFEPDVVHLHSSKAGLAGRLAMRGRRPTLFQPHAWSFLAVHGPMRAASLLWERTGARWAHRLVCCSQSERHQGEEAGVRGRWEVVPNPVDLVRFSPEGPVGPPERVRLDLPPGPLAVCVGRLSRQKGQDVLVEAWAEVRRRVPEARLVLVGDGPERESLEQRASPGVIFAGRQPDVPSWLRAADVVVLPSRYEGMSLSLLEAMATGRSVVASDVEGMGEALGEDAGALVPPEDPGALAAAVATRLLDPALAGREGRAGRDRAERRHDPGRWGERMAQLTLEVAGLSPAPPPR